MASADTAAAQAGGNNASEFVRKLYRMLEDPSHQDVARWGKDGDTFVVVEGEKFTRSILPKHFKHSNMSSFIRQLNKYDFHKVKPSSDAETASPNGNVLEFKHPHFRIDSKNDLDNIRRKAPAPRKPQVTEDFTTSHHISVISEQLTAQQQQVQQLQDLYAEVTQTNRLLVNEVLTLQKMLHAQKQAQHEMLNYLMPYGDGRANNSNSNSNNNSNGNNTTMMQPSMSSHSGMSTHGEDNVPELRRARELLSSVSTDSIADRELERLHGVYGSPAESGQMITPSSMPMLNDPIMSDINRYPVYPVGQTIGIDPFHSDHIHKIPYAMPSDLSAGGMSDNTPGGQQQAQPPPPPPPPQQAQANANSQQQQNASGSGSSDKNNAMWGPKKPLVFLVEDDPICAKIGIKFLKSMGCEVEHASNGADAYNRVSEVGREQFDMIFMDIIMPRLDGVSATLYIRQHCPSTPIIAMTSNIRPEEVNGYFEHGMNGVLAKPFTREGMLKSTKTHMSHLLRNPPQQSENAFGNQSSYFMSGSGYLPAHNNMGNNLKFETPTPPSAATASTWSPGLHQGASPMHNGLEQNFNMLGTNASFTLTPGGSRSYSTKIESPSNQHDSPPEKRQRLNQY